MFNATYMRIHAHANEKCKHILATQLATRMSRCVERTLTEDDLAGIMAHQA